MAMSFVNEMYEGQLLKDQLLEEAELSQDASAWLVTIGFSLRQVEPATIVNQASSKKLRRIYKVVTIQASSGAPLAMKMREI